MAKGVAPSQTGQVQGGKERPARLLSDDGSEFEAGLAQTLEAHGIGRRYSYPKPPKITAHIERFNRTLQESFVDYHEDPLFTGFGLFNQKLADWLVFDSTKRPHHRFGQHPLSDSSSHITPGARGEGGLHRLASLPMPSL
ncbi:MULTISPECIES: integrase core domain-containing protein [Methylococcus]|uniref:integrase core domain-containing protein n=1 Tax=Methylococcus TaxID=413 RepID=UPI001C52CF22|nr:integrase core domain-containing protein [Methylococcus capsulatus]QXP91010.1 integrase core domain-containing protein [Methylococcus capsulatus]